MGKPNCPEERRARTASRYFRRFERFHDRNQLGAGFVTMKESVAPSLVAGMATMLVLMAGTSSQAQTHFTDVTTRVGLVQEAK